MTTGKPPGILESLIWYDSDHLQIGNTTFALTLEQATADAIDSTPERFLLMKSQFLVESTLERLPERVENMIELGIYKGGSIAMYEELFSPTRLVGIDRLTDRVGALDEYLHRHSATDRVKLHYGTDQEDRQALASIARENFGDRCLDLVVDDCSHLYEPTKTSLNVFLPLLRPGGIYLIEDWGWAHWLEKTNQYNQTFAEEEIPLAKLILELVMLSATNPYIIRNVFIDSSRAFITRARDDITDETFDVSKAYSTGLWSMDFSAKASPEGHSSQVLQGRTRRRVPRFGRTSK
jgi:predicted O-methyltransferase YrrM